MLGVRGSIASSGEAVGCAREVLPGLGKAAGCATPIHRYVRPMCCRSQCSYVSDHALILSLHALLGFPSLSYGRAQLPPCCCLLPCPFVPPPPSKELIRGRRREGGLFVQCLLWEPPLDPICPPPPPVTQQALCPRPGSAGHLHTRRVLQRERERVLCASPILLSCLAETFTGPALSRHSLAALF